MRQRAPDGVCGVATLLSYAIKLAHHLGSLVNELRAAMALVRLPLGRTDHTAALLELARIYGKFNEGFATAELGAAHTILQIEKTGRYRWLGDDC